MKIPNGVDIDEGATGRAGARFRIHLGCTARSIVCMYPSTHSHLPLTCLFSLRWRVQTMLQKQKQDRQNILSLPRPAFEFRQFPYPLLFLSLLALLHVGADPPSNGRFKDETHHHRTAYQRNKCTTSFCTRHRPFWSPSPYPLLSLR